MVRASALVALVGLLLVVFGRSSAGCDGSARALGLGAALGFPVGMSAAADEPPMAAARVSVVASIGYTAFLAGPPLIGFLGERSACCARSRVAAGLLALAAMIAGSVMRPP